jgi:hypothetical protein
MEVRYVGPNEEGVEVPTADGQYHLARLEWVDLPADVARGLARDNAEFELAAAKKAAKTRKANAEEDA